VEAIFSAMSTYRLNLQAIESSLRDVQREFPKINEILQSRRDSLTDEIVDNMMAGYMLVDKVLTDDTDLLTSKHGAYLLELNHIVLCGLDPKVRQEHRKHIEATAQRFYGQEGFNLDDILRWHEEHQGESP